MRIALLVTSLFCVVFAGCTHQQLRFNTIKQAKTVADVHTQQVLDNVAKFADNPYALPHFSYPNGGIAGVTDSGNGSIGFRFSPFRLVDWSTGVGGNRTNNESYTMTPINDPRKLELMRCAYQRAVYGCGSCCESSFCPDCQKRFNGFYLGSTAVSKTGEVSDDGHSIHRIKQSVELIYYLGEGPTAEYARVPQSEHGFYVVEAVNSEANEIIYRLHRTDGDVMQGIPGDATFYKLSDVEVESLDELKLIVQKVQDTNSSGSILSILRGGQSIAFDELVKAINEDKLAQRDDKLFLVRSGAETQALKSEISRFVQSDDDSTMRALIDQAPNGSPTGKALIEQASEAEWNEFREPTVAEYEVKVKIPVALESSDLDRTYVDLTIAEKSRRTGKVSASCLCSEGWFCTGKTKQAPKLDHALVGYHGKTAIWVNECGRDQLAKLTLTILDIATNDAPSSPTTDVLAFVSADGKKVSKLEDATYVARATLSRGSSFAGILPSSSVIASPPNENEVKLLTDLAKDLRDRFAKHLSDIDEQQNLQKLINQLANETPSDVEFINNSYRKLKVAVQESDLLIPLAASLLNPEDNSLQNVSAKKEVLDAARDFLNAEYQRQHLKSVVDTPDSIVIGETETPTKSTGASSELLQLQNRLNALGF
jgi:hypothetical protein